MRNGFDAARRLCATAIEEFEAATAAGNRDGIRQAAEKGWLATVEATKALLRHRAKAVPGGTGGQSYALLHLAKDDRRARPLYDLFRGARETLHIRCFYDDEFKTGELEVVLCGDLSRFLRLAERVAEH